MHLRPYQTEGRDFLAARTRALLADTMGLGKTAQAIAAADHIGAVTILVICPGIVRPGWEREFRKFSSAVRTYSVVRKGRDPINPAGVTIISYDLATRPAIHKKLMDHAYDLLIIDEGHFLKTRTAKRTTAIYGEFCKGDTGLISKARYCWVLTGTPTPNNPSEIYPLLRAFGTWNTNYFTFEDTFCQVREHDFGRQIVGARNMPRLKALVKDILLRRKVEEVMQDLPNLRIEQLYLETAGVTHPVEEKEWLDVEKSMQGQELRNVIEEAARDNNVDLSNVRLPTLRRLTGLAKVRPVCNYITELVANGVDKVVVFGEHRDVLEGVRAMLPDQHPLIIYGGNSPETKEKRLKLFIERHHHRVLVGNTKALGTGFDGLQHVCSHAIFIEASWNPSDNAQAIGRLRRSGQTRPVTVKFASLAGSLDEQVQTILTRKTQMVAQLFD